MMSRHTGQMLHVKLHLQSGGKQEPGSEVSPLGDPDSRLEFKGERHHRCEDILAEHQSSPR